MAGHTQTCIYSFIEPEWPSGRSNRSLKQFHSTFGCHRLKILLIRRCALLSGTIYFTWKAPALSERFVNKLYGKLNVSLLILWTVRNKAKKRQGLLQICIVMQRSTELLAWGLGRGGLGALSRSWTIDFSWKNRLGLLQDAYLCFLQQPQSIFLRKIYCSWTGEGSKNAPPEHSPPGARCFFA